MARSLRGGTRSAKRSKAAVACPVQAVAAAVYTRGELMGHAGVPGFSPFATKELFSMAVYPPTLHMLCGRICSGKSTLAARLAAASGTVLVTEDTWLDALYPDELT